MNANRHVVDNRVRPTPGVVSFVGPVEGTAGRSGIGVGLGEAAELSQQDGRDRVVGAAGGVAPLQFLQRAAVPVLDQAAGIDRGGSERIAGNSIALKAKSDSLSCSTLAGSAKAGAGGSVGMPTRVQIWSTEVVSSARDSVSQPSEEA